MRKTAVTPPATARRSTGGLISSSATVTVPPRSSGTQISYVAASKECGEWKRTWVWAPPRQRVSEASAVTAA